MPAAGWNPQVRAALVYELRSHLGADFVIEVREMQHIAREQNGKYRFAICRI
ncbi:MAG: hypothetical protein KAY24_07445 [Candidatus Eisenbacteria sp.]|nr:hypothetical protein [Candidatus Eisenbacteria bacterium]